MKWRISYGFWSWKLINYAKVIMFKEMYSGLVFWLLLKNFIFYGKCHDWLLNLTKFRIIWSSWNSGLCLNVSTFKSCFYSYICESSLCAPVNVSPVPAILGLFTETGGWFIIEPVQSSFSCLQYQFFMASEIIPWKCIPKHWRSCAGYAVIQFPLKSKNVMHIPEWGKL